MIYEDGYSFVKKCDCAKIRESNLNIDRSGLSKIFQQYKFENWKITNEANQRMFEVCREYVDKFDGESWLFIGGQVGSGKTHIATATLQELMKNSHVGVYKRWHEIVKELKIGMNTKDYQISMHELKTASLLYIDDFLKNATDSDMNIAFEIIQARVDGRKPTIITSELLLHKIRDEAVSSRIKQMCGDQYLIQIEDDIKKNFRLRNY